jgi:hypothetical protein
MSADLWSVELMLAPIGRQNATRHVFGKYPRA